MTNALASKRWAAGILAASLATATIEARGDEPTLVDRGADQEASGRTLRTTGMVLTFGGALVATLAVAGFAWSFQDGLDEEPFYAAMIVDAIGVAAMSVGIPLWIVGQRRIRRAQDARVSLALAPTRDGAVGVLTLGGW